MDLWGCGRWGWTCVGVVGEGWKMWVWWVRGDSVCRETENKMCMCERETLVPSKDPGHYSECTQQKKKPEWKETVCKPI